MNNSECSTVYVMNYLTATGLYVRELRN